MRIDIICSDIRHPVWPRLEEWRQRQSARHEVRLVQHVAEASGGDLLFLISCGEIVRAETRSRYRATLVIHASDLPQGRGWSPHIWQVLEGSNRITVSLLDAADKIDDGPIWGKEVIELEGHELFDDINAKIFEVEMRLMDFAVANADSVKPTPQVGSVARHYRKRTPEDSRLDPNKSIAQQFDLLRVADPARFPAFFDFRGHRYLVRLEKKGGTPETAT